jgi:protein-S-isoprenylcysteine O-methyltransferase Ste14
MNILSQVWNAAFWWLAAINLAEFAIGLLVFTSPRLKAAFFRMPMLVQKLLPALNIFPLLLLPLAPQPTWTFMPVAAHVAAGLAAMGAAGVLWFLSLRAFGGIPSIRAAKGLVCAGPYGMVRNPIYLGNMLSALGMALAFRALGALLYVPVTAALYYGTILCEEKDLRTEYGEEYAAYARKVPYRLIPYLL